MDYPRTCIRGIPNSSYMEDDFPNADLFKQFDENPERTDDFNEISISWEDDDKAIQTIMEQKKNASDQFQFKIGCAIISKYELDRLCRKPQIIGKLSYERREVEGNKYHGNILLKKNVTKSLRNMIASNLALCVERVEFRINETNL